MPNKNSIEKLDNKSKELSPIPIQGDWNMEEKKRDSKDYFKTFYIQVRIPERENKIEGKIVTEALIDNFLED